MPKLHSAFRVSPFPRLGVLLVCAAALAQPVRAGMWDRVKQSFSGLWHRKSAKEAAANGARRSAAALGREVGTVSQRLESAQRELLEATAVHENYLHQLRRTERQLVVTNRRVKVATRRYESHRRLLGQRLAAMQRTGRLGYLQLMLSARNLTDLSRRAYYFNAVASRDAALKEELAADRDELQQSQNLLAAQCVERRNYAASAAREQMRIASVAQRQRVALHELNSNRYALLSYANEQDQSAREIEALIGRMSTRRAAVHAAPGGALKPLSIGEVNYRDRMQPAGDDAGSALHQSIGGGDGGWTLPVRGRLSSRFGNRFHPILRRMKVHTGDDLAASYGTHFKSARSGRVLWAGWKKAYGNTIIVDHGDGICTLYGHASKLAVNAGQEVAAGQYLGNVGSTGWSTGPHLHFEVRRNGKPINPTPYLQGH